MLVTDAVQSSDRVDVTSDDVGVVPPGAKAEVIFVNVVRQLARVASVLSAFKNVEHSGLMSEGMRVFVEELLVVDWANVTDVSNEVSTNSLNIAVWKKERTGSDVDEFDR